MTITASTLEARERADSPKWTVAGNRAWRSAPAVAPDSPVLWTNTMFES
jgi:hypothetical protein